MKYKKPKIVELNYLSKAQGDCNSGYGVGSRNPCLSGSAVFRAECDTGAVPILEEGCSIGDWAIRSCAIGDVAAA